jgi:CO/xanthine dehydrogenase Mo-binding subunit
MIITSVGLPECIEKGKKIIDWDKKTKEYKKLNASNGTKKRGLGMCCLMQGSSIPEVDMGSVLLKMNEDGSFNMNLGATDLGTGSDTVMAQIAAETIGCKHTDIIVYSSDTDMTMFDVGAYASSTTYLTGGATINAAKKVRDQIVSVAALIMGEDVKDVTIKDSVCYGKKTKKKVTFSEVANTALYGGENVKKMFQIGAIGSHISHASPPPFAAHFAEVEIDTETGDIDLLHYVAGCDCGTAINPQLALGQVQGAAMNAVSFALTEEYMFDKNGRMQNPTFANYKIWTARDIKKLDCFLAGSYEETGPYGAKSVSEININGGLPAIGNAIYNAIGVRLTRPPYTPEKILAAIKAKKAEDEKAAKKAPAKKGKK